MRGSLKSFCLNENGGGLVEYTLILALIAVVSITLLTEVGTTLQTKLTSINSKLS